MKGREEEAPLDCIVIGAGPGGLQAAIHLARYNFKVLLFHHPGGRTWHARRIENYLGLQEIAGPALLETGLAQAARFGVAVERGKVERVTRRDGLFEVRIGGSSRSSRFVIAASGARESLAPIKNIERFFGVSYFTCLICDGYRTTGKKLLVTDCTVAGIRTSLGMKQLYTDDVTFLAHGFAPPPEYAALLADEGIPWIEGRPEALVGDKDLSGVLLSDGRTIDCEAVMGWGGIALNDDYLSDLPLQRDANDFKFRTHGSSESSIPGLFVLGALRRGHSQAIISAGQGAEAAIEISSRLVDL